MRHRQTKGAATDMFYLTPPRHISTLHLSDVLRPSSDVRLLMGGVGDPTKSSGQLDPKVAFLTLGCVKRRKIETQQKNTSFFAIVR